MSPYEGTAVPGGRIDRAENAIEQATPHHLPAEVPVTVTSSVPVHAEKPLRTVNAASAHANYFTITLSASTGGIPAVQQILPRDDDRVVAYLMPIDGPVIIATTLEQAQDPTNVGGTYPSGITGSGTYRVSHREPVYAANPSTSATMRISVMVESGGAA
jgi:hypothetical protein